MKITKQMLKKQFSNTDLEKFVLKDILEDIKNYNGSFIERLKTRLADINHGCISRTVNKLIYNSDCLKFFTRFIDDISELVIALEANMGLPLENRYGLPIYTFYAWLAYEETAYQINSFIEDKSVQ